MFLINSYFPLSKIAEKRYNDILSLGNYRFVIVYTGNFME